MYPQGVCRIRKPAYAGNGCAIFLVFQTEEVGQKDGCGSQTQLRGVATMKTLVLLRHGESEWNLENRFTGWTDVDLTPKGIEEAKAAGQLMKAQGFHFDLAYISCLKRANHTLAPALGEMGEENIPVVRSWKLNERHYGALQGLNKAETAKKYGEEHVHIWRRSFDVQPPALTPEDDRSPARQPLYADVPVQELTLTESLKDTIARVIPYFQQTIAPQMEAGKHILIAAQGKAKKASLTARRAPGKTQLPVLAGSCVRYSLFTHLHPRQLSQQPRHFFFLGRKSSHRKYPAMGASSA